MKYNLCLCNEVGGTTEEEQVALLNLVDNLKATEVLEIGTFRGHTAQAIAQNFPAVQVATVDLPPGLFPELPDIPCERPYYDIGKQRDVIVASNAKRFYHDSGLLNQAKLELFGWLGKFDLVFVDGGHSLAQVLNDSLVAVECVRSGGVIVWHDYGEPYLDTVCRVVNGLFAGAMQIPHTRLAWWRKP
ncbi:MAG: class I SAM-dependent methyltransferase [Thiothrix sp.]|jgi:hypothetical protein|uniref:class I SAM-dependent methyltransferase n=1 Tax=Thiothrix sp. TaxID=1032 RepID=UPI002627A1FD|nr:class I SAM-dependent methyltransferase [Thiothrix sp.]MDD5395178.1 class I SAM-dependent methyltransferase [Thiothrix sp.]